MSNTNTYSTLNANMQSELHAIIQMLLVEYEMHCRPNTISVRPTRCITLNFWIHGEGILILYEYFQESGSPDAAHIS